MSSAALLELNRPEEALVIDIERALIQSELPHGISPIADYFGHTQLLIGRFVQPQFSNDSETLSLLVLGVVSAAEFYFRSVMVQSLDLCPYAKSHADRAEVSLGALRYYGTKIRALGFSIFEHKSLAGSDEIKKELSRLTGLQVKQGTSVEVALKGFDTLCELRHSAIHARGFVGFKNASDLGVTSSSLRRLSISQNVVFDLTKLSHNAVRSFNRYVLDGILQRWISERYLTGVWRSDKTKFSALFSIFSFPEENTFGTDVAAAYRSIQPNILARLSAV